jgi:hypothetical protein
MTAASHGVALFTSMIRTGFLQMAVERSPLSLQAAGL